MVHSLNTPGPTLVVVVTTITTNTAHDEHTTLYLNFSRSTLNCFADLLGLFRSLSLSFSFHSLQRHLHQNSRPTLAWKILLYPAQRRQRRLNIPRVLLVKDRKWLDCGSSFFGSCGCDGWVVLCARRMTNEKR